MIRREMNFCFGLSASILQAYPGKNTSGSGR
jgi:hypothetical protein